MWISPRSFGKARVVSHVDAGAGATLAAAMDLLRVAAFVGVCRDVEKASVRADLHRCAAFDVRKALVVRVNTLDCIVAHAVSFCACSATTTDLLQRVVAVYRARCQLFVA